MELQTLATRFRNLPYKLVGVGVTAFNRVMPAYFLPDYQLVCYKDSLELVEIAKKCPVFSIERDCQMGIKKLSSLAILNNPEVKNYLKGLGLNLGILVYKPTEGILNVCKENGWQLIGNRPEVRDPFENKKIFRETLLKIGVRPIEGEVFKIEDFDDRVLTQMQVKYGQKLVLKLPEVAKGGGIGNTFLESDSDWERFWSKVEKFKEKHHLRFVIVERKIKGISPSITGCVTRFGVLTGVVQTQIIDIPEVVNTKTGDGMFVGHDWSFCHYEESIQQQARNIAKRFGEYLYQKGYLGIFGIDLIIEKGTNRVYPCECNPRYTGAFPVYSMIQWKNGEPPFDVFHLLEHLKINYELDFPKTQALYWQKKEGAHLLLYNIAENWQQITGEIKAGVFKLANGELKFIRPGFSLLEIENEEEFVLTDGVPKKGTAIKPGMRILKVIFPGSILAGEGKEIDQRTKEIVAAIYRHLQLQKVAPPKDYLVEDTEY